MPHDDALISVSQARSRILAAMSPVEPHDVVPLGVALGRHAALDVTAPAAVPPFDSSAVDGYVLAVEVPPGASARFELVGDARAGHPFQGPAIVSGQAVRILTGAAVPLGGAGVAMQEDAAAEGGWVEVRGPVAAGDHIRLAGSDQAPGQTLVAAGDRLHAARLAVLAAAGIERVAAIRRVRVAYFSTGDELREPGEGLGDGHIFESNRRLLAGLLAEPWIEARDLGIVPDQPDRLRAALQAGASWADAVLTTGGVSVGDTDYMTGLVGQIGHLDFWRVAVKPGKPLAFGRIGGACYFGLPGNPVSAAITALLFVRPALAALAGSRWPEPRLFPARLALRLAQRPGRETYVRASLSRDPGDDGLPLATPLDGQGSHQLAGLAGADALIRVPADASELPAGSMVQVLPLPWLD